MALTTLAVPKEYGYVILAAASTFFVGYYHISLTGRRRRAAKVPYPRQFSETFDQPTEKMAVAERTQKQAEYAFNCAQRAHGQYLEHLTIFLPALMISGVRWPLISAALGGAWTVSRVLYAYGYVNSTKPEGKGRYLGGIYMLWELVLMGMTAKLGFDIAFS